MIIGVLVFELVSVVAVVAVVEVVVGAVGAAAVVTFTAGAVFTFVAVGATFTPVAGFAAPVAVVVVPPNRLGAAIAPAAGMAISVSRDSVSAVAASRLAVTEKRHDERGVGLCMPVSRTV
jgi:hypothetical protein